MNLSPDLHNATSTLDIFASSLQYNQWGRYLGVAFITLVVYDYLLTFGEEVEYVHKTRWSMPIYLFLANRYWLLITFVVVPFQLFWKSPPDAFCYDVSRYLVVSFVTIGALVGASMVVRLNAFWNWHRTVFHALLLLCAVCLSTTILSVYICIKNLRLYHGPFHAAHGCLLTVELTVWNYFTVIPAIVFDSVIVGLTVLRARELGANTQMPIISHVYHTGLGYYLVMLTANLLTVLAFAWPTTLLPVIVRANVSLVCASLLCSRMLLSLRAHATEQQAPTLLTMDPISESELEAGAGADADACAGSTPGEVSSPPSPPPSELFMGERPPSSATSWAPGSSKCSAVV